MMTSLADIIVIITDIIYPQFHLLCAMSEVKLS